MYENDPICDFERLFPNIRKDFSSPANCESAAQLLLPMKLLDHVWLLMTDMFRSVLRTSSVSSLVITHKLELSWMVHRNNPSVGIAFSAIQRVAKLPRQTSTTRLLVVSCRAIKKLSFSIPKFEPEPLPKSIILSQKLGLPKSASKSTVIPPLNELVLISGKSINGPAAFVPPGNFQAPVRKSMSKRPGSVTFLSALFPLPERSFTDCVVPKEFRSEEL